MRLVFKDGMFLLVFGKAIRFGGIANYPSFRGILESNEKAFQFKKPKLFSFGEDALCEEVFLTINDGLIYFVLMGIVSKVVFFIELVEILVVFSIAVHDKIHF